MPALRKWGNSLALRIPAPLARQLNLTEDTQVECTVIDGSLMISPVPERSSYSLDQLLERVSPENLHSETDTAAPAGQETW